MNETYYENYCSRLTQKGKSYRVKNLLEDQTIYVEESIVSMISEEAKEDPHLVDIILAIIKITRMDGTIKTPRSKDKPSDAAVFNCMVDILSKYSAVQIIDVLKEIKWHELKEIINSATALEEYEQYINS